MKKYKIIAIYFLQRWVIWFEKYLLKTDYSTEKSLKKEDYSLIEDALVKLAGLLLLITIFLGLFLPAFSLT